ncbi:DUF1127 domain-containing protein [Afifella marina]|uniref:DUF1127 domain-containing protein n=1 Tax=Afifella marina DSM 2698 TaxID=1120955 RepID=A0A1G5MXA0_AFIMA|nr:DUF1127 domain-containing protein [Afifella marina]MBK1622128.1 hypothetical protein [Afifella marina DSM 2698]MBK1628254.1 hypothetical protein [Afifella marina]MBK5918912.1 hypothetical protein [Afifella marina]RAI17773.1 hypothetical protein CH311_17230 [Afifella marina DSM 2698]SCZ29736.1 hypothetical protein SAMN03080610_01161 [Afifella marina DSM 2698]
MKTLTLARPASAPLATPIGASARNLFSRAWTSVKQRYQYGELVRELEGYRDRDLADMGFDRSEIRRVAYEGAYGRSRA